MFLSLQYHLLNIIIINSLITVILAITTMIGNFKPNLNKREVWFSKSLGVNSCDAYNTFVDYQFCFFYPPSSHILLISFLSFFLLKKCVLLWDIPGCKWCVAHVSHKKAAEEKEKWWHFTENTLHGKYFVTPPELQL